MWGVWHSSRVSPSSMRTEHTSDVYTLSSFVLEKDVALYSKTYMNHTDSS